MQSGVKYAKSIQLKILKDTTQTKNYKIAKIGFYDKNALKYSKEILIEVICENDINDELIGKLQDALRRKRLYSFPNSFEFDTNTMNALTRFQLINDLNFMRDYNRDHASIRTNKIILN